MKYGFVIDNRKCIGCHACTTACKSEHQVPVGVNRTWVKQVEKGIFPNSRRLFSVMRCNHCTDAPCVEICPVEALFVRPDGIVDFDKNRCIGCKSCMQACPYDALYIDPDSNTAAKCNYCAHRIDLGLEPACVNVCPEHAIISGDMDNPESEIAQLLSRQQVKVRKPEKATVPNLFYIDADDASLVPSASHKEENYFWNSQSLGVGHYAKQAEKLAYTNEDVLSALMQKENGEKSENVKSIDLLLGKTKNIYDAPDKGILWGWEVSGYVWTKAIAAGAFLVPFAAWAAGIYNLDQRSWLTALIVSMLFLLLTGILLIKDLDRPDRFLNVLFRPQWKSWLVKGGYSITLYGGLLTALILTQWLGLDLISKYISWLTAAVAIMVAIYTAFLFGQAKGRDFWQSPTLALHMLLHSLMAGAALFSILNLIWAQGQAWSGYLSLVLIFSLLLNLVTITFELTMSHPTADAQSVVQMILKGRYSKSFWLGVVILGNLIPLALLITSGENDILLALASIAVLIGIYFTEHIWVEAPQRLPLS